VGHHHLLLSPLLVGLRPRLPLALHRSSPMARHRHHHLRLAGHLNHLNPRLARRLRLRPLSAGRPSHRLGYRLSLPLVGRLHHPLVANPSSLSHPTARQPQAALAAQASPRPTARRAALVAHPQGQAFRAGW
jgi:hypothetical protein